MEKKISQNKLAIECQIQGWQLSRETLSKIEAGLRCVTDAEVLFLAQILNCTVMDLIEKNPANLTDIVRHSRDREG